MSEKYGKKHKEYIFIHKDGKTFRRLQNVGSDDVNFSSKIVNDYLKVIASSGLHEKQLAFFQWQIANSKVVKPVHTNKIENPQVKKINEKYPPLPKACYLNASHLALNVPGCIYVEGIVSFNGIPIDHAWNKINGKYFDSTYDIALEGHTPFDEYLAIIELDKDELKKYQKQGSEYESLISKVYRDKYEIKKSDIGNINSIINDDEDSKLIDSIFKSNQTTEIEHYISPYISNRNELNSLMYDIEEISKGGKRAAIGEIRVRANGIKERKTATGWEYIGKVKGPPEDKKVLTEDTNDISLPTVDNDGSLKDAEEISETPKQKPSKYQQAIYDFIKYGTGNAAVDAKAGSGKTTTIVNALNYIPQGKKIAFVAFSKAIVEELDSRVPDHVNLSTLHSFGFKAIKETYGRNVKLDNNKNYLVLNQYVEELVNDHKFEDQGERASYMSNIFKLISVAKHNVNYDPSFLSNEAGKLNIDLVDDEVNHIKSCLGRLFKRKDIVDYDDMIYLPAVDSTMRVEKFDYVFVDECQDLNKAQLKMLQKMFSPELGQRFVAVGDPQQAIFGFAGSDENSFSNIAGLNNTVTLPLSVSYRCAKNIIKYVVDKTGVPIEAFEGASDGEVNTEASVTSIKDGDMVLCRNTAPLIALCMKFISEKKAAHIRGKDIGEVLANQIQRLTPKNLLNSEEGFKALYSKIDAEIEKTVNKLLLRGLKRQQIEEHASIINLKDRKECFEALRDDSKTPNDMILNIRNIFSEAKSGGIQLSTAHRSKGLEAEKVFIIEDQLLHGGMARNDFQKIQENNLRYVAYTRAKKSLNIVTDWEFYKKKEKQEKINKSFNNALFSDYTIEKAEYSDVILCCEGQVVMLLRNAKDGKEMLDHKWSFPGGHVDAGESFINAAQRELSEETNIDVHINDLHHVYEFITDDAHINYYCVDITKEQLQKIVLDNEEHNNYRLVSPDEFSDLEMICDLNEYIDQIFSNIIFLQTKNVKTLSKQLPPEQTGTTEQVYTEIAFTDDDLEKAFEMAIDAFDKEELTLDQFLEAKQRIEKARTAQVGEIRTWNNGSYQKTPNGWVPIHDPSSEQKPQEKPKEKEYSEQELKELAKRASLEDLENTIRTSTDPLKRKIAHNEIARREKHEHVKEKSTK